jgi:hypothetical protein
MAAWAVREIEQLSLKESGRHTNREPTSLSLAVSLLLERVKSEFSVEEKIQKLSRN